MKNLWKVFAILLSIFVVAYSQCSPDCLYCDPAINVCIVCQGLAESSVFGVCHPNTIDKCIMYGPSDECYRCQPTYVLKNGKCERAYTGCISSGS